MTTSIHLEGGQEDNKMKTLRKWFSRRQLKPDITQIEDNEKVGDKIVHTMPIPPQTAPSTKAKQPPDPSTIGQAERRHPPPPRPPRPNSNVIRDVNAWLDSSTVKPGPPLMEGVKYWREAAGPSSSPSPDIQYAVPIAPDGAENQQPRTIYRCAKKIQVRMPSSLRIKSQRTTVKQANRRSASMPVISLPIQTRGAPNPMILSRTRPDSITPSNTSQSIVTHQDSWKKESQYQLSGSSLHLERPVTLERGARDSNSQGRTENSVVQSARYGSGLRPSTAGNSLSLSREDSLGKLSDAPTYITGPPPPPYRSRTVSILSTSSFGCVDGMPEEQRLVSQQRAQRNKGIKGRIRRFAQKANLR